MRYFHELIIAIILGMGLFIAGFYIGANSSFYFLQYKQRKAVQNLAKEMQKAREKEYQRLMADTYGGKTPQETLQMFIEAVEKGDYEIASKYFVFDKQEKWLKNLIDIKQHDKFNNFLPPLKESLNSVGEYSIDKKGFSIYDPIGVDFILYPNGIWKLSEI